MKKLFLLLLFATLTARAATYQVALPGGGTLVINGLPYLNPQITNSASVVWTTNANGLLTLAATAVGTNASIVFVEGAAVSSPNFGVSTEIDPAVVTTNVTFSIVNSSITTNKIDPTFYSLLMQTGSGDVVGPASAIDGRLALFDGATGKLLKVGTLNEAALALLTAANVFTSTNTFQGPSIFATLIITNLDLLNPLPTASRGAIWGADNRLTNDVADTGTGAPVRAVSPALTGSPTVPTASVGSSNTLAASTEYVDRAVGAGGGGGGGTSVTVNGSTVNPAKFTNNAAATGGISLATNANGEILMVATNFPAGGGDASVGGNNVFTGVNRFTNGTPQSFSRPPRVLGGRIASWTAPQMTPGTNASIQAQYRVLGDGVSSMEFDGTTSEEISMLGVLGQDPDTGSTVTLTFASDDTANTVCWQAQWQLLTLRGIDTNLLSTAATWTSNIPGTARVPTNITIALNPPTGVVGGTNDFSKPFMLRITRLPGSDSSLSNAYLIAVDHRYAQ